MIARVGCACYCSLPWWLGSLIVVSSFCVALVFLQCESMNECCDVKSEEEMRERITRHANEVADYKGASMNQSSLFKPLALVPFLEREQQSQNSYHFSPLNLTIN